MDFDALKLIYSLLQGECTMRRKEYLKDKRAEEQYASDHLPQPLANDEKYQGLRRAAELGREWYEEADHALYQFLHVKWHGVSDE